MRILWGKGLLIVGALLSLTVARTHAAAYKRETRDTKHETSSQASGSNAVAVNDFDMSGLKNFLDMIPILGPMTDEALAFVTNELRSLNNMSDGLLSRILGGTLPCKLTATSLTCSNKANNGGSFAVVKNVLQLVPDSMLPDGMKPILLGVLRLVVNPIAETVAGTKSK